MGTILKKHAIWVQSLNLIVSNWFIQQRKQYLFLDYSTYNNLCHYKVRW